VAFGGLRRLRERFEKGGVADSALLHEEITVQKRRVASKTSLL